MGYVGKGLQRREVSAWRKNSEGQQRGKYHRDGWWEDGRRIPRPQQTKTGGTWGDVRLGDVGEGLERCIAVTVLGRFLSQLRAQRGISAVLGRSCVTFPAKTVTAPQIKPERQSKTDAFAYICTKIHAFQERCGEWTKRKNVLRKMI